jgi:hypothetical protein
MKRQIAALFLASAAAFPQLSPQEKAEGFRPMFNRKNLDGWDGDPRLWKVVDGAVTGSTEGVTLKANSFLISKKEYSDFVFRAQVKLRNHNSGIQFRSEALPDWVVRGLQADMAENNYWGSIYDERGKRGIMVNGWTGKAEKVVKPGDWNEVEIYCKGEEIRIQVNGLTTAEIKDSVKMSGVIAFQLHRGPEMKAEFRNVRIRELK